MFEEDHRVGIADRRVQEPLVVGAGIGRHDLEPGDMRVPAGIALRMLRGDPGGDAVRAAEHDRRRHLAARHIAGLGGRVDQLVHRLHREVEGHELDDRPEAGKSGANTKPGEALLGDRRVDDPARPNSCNSPWLTLKAPSYSATSSPISKTHWVAPHFLGHGIAQRLAHGLREGLAGVFLERQDGRRWRRRERRGAGSAGARAAGARVTGARRAAAAPTSSPFSAITAIGVLTATCSVPSGMTIWASMPSSTASTSIVALSVSISASTSPGVHGVALRLDPARDLALGHRRRQRRHQHLAGHSVSSASPSGLVHPTL